MFHSSIIKKIKQKLSYFYYLKVIACKEPKLISIYLKNTFRLYILWIKEDITFSFKNINITMPNHLKWIDGFIEVWSDKFYEKIHWYNHVLDLWWYIGDSAIKFWLNNKFVTVYEAHPENFKYLEKNIKKYSNVKAYNFAVVWNSNVNEIDFFWGWFNMWAWVNNKWIKISVKTKNIIEILKSNDFDALKMDIEWAEFECLESIMKSPELFKFKIWFIEFHLWENKEINISKTIIFKNWLIKNWYNIGYYDVINNIHPNNLEDIKSWVFLIYFKK